MVVEALKVLPVVIVAIFKSPMSLLNGTIPSNLENFINRSMIDVNKNHRFKAVILF
jgi:hypothetical protein